MPKVNPDILVWARETAGLSEQDAAKKLGLSSPERLEALESGKRDPSRRQLLNMSEKYRRPLLTFYLPKEPKTSNKGRIFGPSRRVGPWAPRHSSTHSSAIFMPGRGWCEQPWKMPRRTKLFLS